MKINKTNAARLLDKAKIAYELIPYAVDENNLAADHVAQEADGEGAVEGFVLGGSIDDADVLRQIIAHICFIEA